MNFFGVNPQFFVGDFVYKRCGTCGPRIQQTLQLVYIYQGDAVIRINGKEHYLGARQATLLLPGSETYFVFSKKARTRHGWCELKMPRLEKATVRAYEQLPFSLPFTPLMETLTAVALPLVKDLRASRQRLLNALSQAIFMEFLSLAGFGDDADKLYPEPVRLACDYIETQYQNPCDLDRLAKVSRVTGAHLIRLFRKHLNSTPIEFLWRKRVEAGAQLLKETGLEVSEIAYRTGFQNPYHFSRLTKKHLGESPRKYRQMAWGIK